jgi:hypothetical protein
VLQARIALGKCALKEAEIAREIENYQRPGGEAGPATRARLERLKRISRDTPTADALPSYSQMFVTPNKTLWVVDGTYPGRTEWTATAFRSDGAMIGRLTVPGKYGAIGFADDRVALRFEDEDGDIFLNVYRIVPLRK